MRGAVVFLVFAAVSSSCGQTLDNKCGTTIWVRPSPTTYYTASAAQDWGQCTLHFQRPDPGHIQLTVKASSLFAALCRVDVVNGYNGSSLSQSGASQTSSRVRQIFTSDDGGQLGVRLQGRECGGADLTLTVRNACPPASSFPCDNGKCLPQALVCDAIDECGDNSDEDACPCSEFTCNNGRCLPQFYVCDGSDECGDNSDEASCSGCTGFTCDNGHCVPQSYRCDNEDDCGDNSDEANCHTCSGFTCSNGNCVPQSYKCDQEDDCGDNSDEGNCPAPSDCRGYQCANGQCVRWSHVCDDFDDCGDDSDETGCHTVWTASAYVAVSIGVFVFVCIVAGLAGCYYRRRVVVRGPRILIPVSRSMVAQSRW